VQPVGVIDGPFPIMHLPQASGLGDYVGIVKRGLPGGYLFPTWARPEKTSELCTLCQGGRYRKRIYATRILP